jgi:riboflavin biosynthesis pyrimidine reductase
MRTLIGEETYEWPTGPWLRANMVMTVDGSAVGPDGLSGTINNEADHMVFDLLREGADAVVVGAGTVRAEGYAGIGKQLVVVGHALPERLHGQAGVRLATGGDADELRDLVAGLYAEGFASLLCEGGPTLLSGLLRAGVVDELCLTITPMAVGGDGRRITVGPLFDAELRLAGLIEDDGTLLARYLVDRG